MRVLSVSIGALFLSCIIHVVNSQAAEAYGQSLLDYYNYYTEGSCNTLRGTVKIQTYISGAEFEAKGLPSPVGSAKYRGPALGRLNTAADYGTYCDGGDTFKGNPTLYADDSRVIQYGNSQGSMALPEVRINFIPSFDGYFPVIMDSDRVKFTNVEFEGQPTDYATGMDWARALKAYQESPDYCMIELYINARRADVLSAPYTPEVFLTPIGPGCSKQGIEVYNSAYYCDGYAKDGAMNCNTNDGPNFSAVVMIYRKQSAGASIADDENVFAAAAAPAPSNSTTPSFPTSFGTVTASPSKLLMFGMVCAVVSSFFSTSFLLYN